MEVKPEFLLPPAAEVAKPNIKIIAVGKAVVPKKVGVKPSVKGRVLTAAEKEQREIAEKREAAIHARYNYDTQELTNRTFRKLQEAMSYITQLDNIEEGVARSAAPPENADALRRDRKKIQKTLAVAMKRVGEMRALKIRTGVEMERKHNP